MAGALRRWNARRTSPSIRAIREAGPPIAYLATAGVGGLVAVVALFVLGIRSVQLLIATPLSMFVLACVADRDGWRIRMATSELAAAQRTRWTRGQLPIDPLSAEAWLSAHPDAPAAERAAVLVTAGRPADALAVISSAGPADPLDRVRLVRLRLAIEASLADELEPEASMTALKGLPELAVLAPEEARYQRLSLGWSLAWQAIARRRPWRHSLLRAIDGLGPFRPPLRYVAFQAIQHFAFPIAYSLAWLVVYGLGVMDALLGCLGLHPAGSIATIATR